MFHRTSRLLSAACLGLALVSSQSPAQGTAPGADGLIKYTDFQWGARRYGIVDRQQPFATASGVVESITSTVRAR